MSILLHGDCLEEMKGLDDNSVDLIFCDLPYGQTSCKWDCCIDLDKFWVEVMRIKKLNTPIFFTTTTKFGVSLINSAPKKCHFRYDIVWVKSAPAGFLSAKKMPMRKHEMIYVFYEKLPFYDLSSHQQKFVKHKENTAEESNAETYGKIKRCPNGQVGQYDPPLPNSVIKEDCYEKNKSDDSLRAGHRNKVYDPPLPVSVVKEELCKYDVNKNTYGGGKEGRIKISKDKKDHQQKYDPPLPVSVVKEEVMTKDFTPNKNGNIYDCPDNQEFAGRNGKPRYEPPLPVSVVKEEMTGGGKEDIRKDKHTTAYGDNIHHHNNQQRNGESIYEPPLPNSMLEIKSTRGKHSTEKPVALMEWVLKYYSKEGDVVLDPTMGSGSTGVACVNMKRNFIGIEKDTDIYEVAVNRINE